MSDDQQPMATKARVLHWFVRGGQVKTPDGVVVNVDVDPLVIGRAEGAQILVNDPEVSSIHCELRAVNEGIAVKDLGSTNGTFIGPVRIREVILTTHTELTIGQSKLLVEPAAKHRVDVGFSDRFGPLVG